VGRVVCGETTDVGELVEEGGRGWAEAAAGAGAGAGVLLIGLHHCILHWI
jgi:hypothetical protein